MKAKVEIKKDVFQNDLDKWYVSVRDSRFSKFEWSYVHKDGTVGPSVINEQDASWTGRYKTRERARQAARLYRQLEQGEN